MNQHEFDRLAQQGYSLIPVMREVLADLDTPLSTYLKLAEGPHSYLLESVQGGEKWGRYSIIGLPCRTVARISGHDIVVSRDGEEQERAIVEDPTEWLEEFRARYRVPEIEGLPRFTGGLVGYFGYDTVRYIEPRLARCPNPDPLGTPDILLMVSDEVVVLDNLAGKLFVVVHADPTERGAFDRAQQRLDGLVQRLREARSIYPSPRRPQPVIEEDFVSGFTRAGFERAVERAKRYIVDGDVMQVVLSQRLSIPYQAEPLDLYRALRSLNPSPYMYFLDLGDFHVVGSSPEILTRLEDSRVTVRPIAGTRPRGATEEEDRAWEAELLADPKERAEHLMLIDLGRNDVGRVSEIGSVQLTERMVIERYSHVMHIVSNVIGRLAPGLSAIDVLRATFPAGTVSGAPKIRAMEIIDELEPVKRGVYSGAVGYVAWSGNMDTAIAIRTAVIKDGTLHIQAGAGVVADSVPENEWHETMSKGRAIFKAVAMAAAGLDAVHR
ncbi:MAG: anthranilate synthase component I [Gammaproteobacteria bacterium]|nr:anthranilate synthase component I [Gammaproteobacteria bacterium]NIR90021.1 anthranilate synthase component I [Gammaproteobacteria bacterium]NIR99150.1 anthranilate synthase component I [Gammaproteobacteria bacterium]NIT64790.1 anthranilate synthase component I [Gammaproteobacteria bacterium]NIV53640.1 anthranilate synthase component I [Gammaproteobacteria bacterium]